MTAAASPSRTFRYRAQAGGEGKPFAGAIEADDAQDARHRLTRLGLWVVEFDDQPVPLPALPAPAEASLPNRLRWAAADIRPHALVQAVRQAADQIDRGLPPAEALRQPRAFFPLTYAEFFDAALARNNVPEILAAADRHQSLERRQMIAMWLNVLLVAGLLAIELTIMGMILGLFVPMFEPIFNDFGTTVPGITNYIIWFSKWFTGNAWDGQMIPGFVFAAMIPAAVILGAIGPVRRNIPGLAWFILGLPILGPAVAGNLAARWCDAVRMCLDAGLDPASAIEQAGLTLLWKSARQQSHRLAESLRTGQSTASVRPGMVIPPTIKAAIDMGVSRPQLTEVLAQSAEASQQRADLRMDAFLATLNPILVTLAYLFAVVIVIAMLLPLVVLITSLTGGHR